MLKITPNRFVLRMILAILLVELISFCAWALPDFGNIAYLIILGIVLFFSLEDLRIGVALVLVELIIGSHGYLLSFGPDNLSIALRHGLFLLVLVISLLRSLQKKRVEFIHSRFFLPWLLLLIMAVLSMLWGYIQGNALSNVFFDSNAFAFFLLAIPLWEAISTRKDLELLIYASVAALLMSVVKVFFLLYAFSHKFWWMLQETYKWVRDTRIGEITQVTDLFFRIFFQSQIYTIIGFIFILLWLTYLLSNKHFRGFVKTIRFWMLFLFGSALFASVLISFSRSNWVGVFAAAICVPLVFYFSVSKPLRQTGRLLLLWVGIGVTSLAMVTSIVLFPYPKPSGDFDPTNLLSKRAFTFTGEAGVSSRWQLLPPLWGKITERPIIGSGFGTTVTYVTEDPRIRAQSPTGEYTTFAFEWGYLDLWLKLGLIGMLVYAYFVLRIALAGFVLLRRQRDYGTKAMDMLLNQGLLLGAIALLATHTFSPYLNHPLGIGFLLFWALTVEILSSSNQEILTEKR